MILVLMVEDNVYDARLAAISIASSFTFIHAHSMAEAIEFLKTQSPKAIILDLNLPDSLGLASVDLLATEHPDIPIVVWSAANDAAKAIHHGADDFVLKDRDVKALEEAVIDSIARHKYRQLRKEVRIVQKAAESGEAKEKSRGS